MLARVYRAALDLQAFCTEQRWPFCFIGGVALLRWSDPRMTDDADVTVFTDFGGEENFVDALLARFEPRIENARHFGLRSRVLLLQHANGVPLDVALGALPYELRTVERSSLWCAAKDCELRTCSAEDLIVHKAFAGREQDWLDIESIVRRRGDKVDWGQVFAELPPLAELKEDPGIVDELRRRVRKHGLQLPS